MWFQLEGAEGAGLYEGISLNSYLTKVSHVKLEEAHREDFDGASDGEIEHDEEAWVCQNLQPTLKYKTKGGQLIDVDIRPEVLQKFRLPFRSGDVIQDKHDAEKMTCIGVAKRPSDHIDTAKVEIWFHVEGTPGAGINVNFHRNLGRFEVVANKAMEAFVPSVQASEGMQGFAPSVQPSGWDKETAEVLLTSLTGSLQCDFPFPCGAGSRTRPDLEWFDVRPEEIQNITGWLPGTVLTLPGLGPDVRLTLIGLRTDAATGEPDVWWHFRNSMEVHAGAGKLPGWLIDHDDMQEVESWLLNTFTEFVCVVPNTFCNYD